MDIYVEAAISLSYKTDSFSAGNKIGKKKIVWDYNHTGIVVGYV